MSGVFYFWTIYCDMRYIITESQSDDLFSNLLKKKNIKYDIVYLNDNGYDSITATVYLYKDGEVFGYRHGHEFFFKYDSRFNRLTPDGHFPKLENIKELFAFMPPSAHKFTFQFKDICLNLWVFNIWFLEYFSLKNKGESIKISQL